MRKTKIVCTIGPASDNIDTLKKLMIAGMNVARINFSHGSYEEQAQRIENIKKARQELNLPVALLLDTKGPEIRIGKVDCEKIMLNQGDKFILSCADEFIGNKDRVCVSWKELSNQVSPGTKILINDGIVEIEVIKIENQEIICKVIHGGPISSRKSINIPGLNLNLPNPTEKDIQDLKYSVSAGFDFVAVSFVRCAQDVINVRKVLQENNGEHIKIISKIENRQGIDKFDEILAVSDGIMVARGDLGVEIPMEQVPILQKEFIKKAAYVGKPVITATQMLESMVTNSRPTRAEVSDVANAIFDMTSSIMLSAETATGKFPVECVETMSKIAIATEETIDYWSNFRNREKDIKTLDNEYSMNHAMCLAAANTDAKAIIAYTKTGDTPRILSSFLPKCPIYAITENETTYRQLGLCWNIYPNVYSHRNSIDDLLQVGIRDLRARQFIKKDDNVVIAGGANVIKQEDNTEYQINRVVGGILKI